RSRHQTKSALELVARTRRRTTTAASFRAPRTSPFCPSSREPTAKTAAPRTEACPIGAESVARVVSIGRLTPMELGLIRRRRERESPTHATRQVHGQEPGGDPGGGPARRAADEHAARAR